MLNVHTRILISVLIAACLGLVGCSTLTVPSNTQETLHVGVTANFPPFIDKKGAMYTGVEAEFAAGLAKHLGRELVFVDLKWDTLLTKLEAGEIDIVMSGMTITEPRRLRASFGPPYLTSGQVVMVRATDARKYRDPRVLTVSADRVAVEAGTTGDLLVQRNFEKVERVPYRGLKKATDDLIKGKVDAVIGDAAVLFQLSAEREADGVLVIPQAMTKEYIAWAMRKGDTDLTKYVNEFFLEWDQNGKMDAVLNRWIPQHRQLGQ